VQVFCRLFLSLPELLSLAHPKSYSSCSEDLGNAHWRISLLLHQGLHAHWRISRRLSWHHWESTPVLGPHHSWIFCSYQTVPHRLQKYHETLSQHSSYVLCVYQDATVLQVFHKHFIFKTGRRFHWRRGLRNSLSQVVWSSLEKDRLIFNYKDHHQYFGFILERLF